MSPYVFLALCILGTGFMTYAFFQWTYGDKHGAGCDKEEAESSGLEHRCPLPASVVVAHERRYQFLNIASPQAD